MSNYRTCVFCNNNDSRPTNEDIFANWIAREFPGPVSVPWEAIDLNTGKMFKTKNRPGFVSNKVCQRCNNGWMATIENEAKRVMLPLIHCSRSILSSDNQVLIARWLLKTAMVCDIFNKIPYFKPSERQNLLSNIRPENVWMFLACYRGSHIGEIAVRSGFYHSDPNASRDDQGHFFDPDGYVFTVLMKHLALQVFCLRTSEKCPPGTRITMPGKWADVSIHIPVNRDVIWPPPLVFDKDGFDEFVLRWGELGMIV